MLLEFHVSVCGVERVHAFFLIMCCFYRYVVSTRSPPLFKSRLVASTPVSGWRLYATTEGQLGTSWAGLVRQVLDGQVGHIVYQPHNGTVLDRKRAYRRVFDN